MVDDEFLLDVERYLRQQRRAARIKNGIKDIPRQVRLVPMYARYLWNFSTDPENQSVIPSLIAFYVLCFWDGWYNAVVVDVPTQVLAISLGPLAYKVFVWVTMVAPCLTLAGMCLRGKWAWTGALMQLAGNLGVAGVLTTFVAAVFTTQWWGQGNFATTWVIASMFGSYLFIIRDIRRLTDKKRWVKHG